MTNPSLRLRRHPATDDDIDALVPTIDAVTKLLKPAIREGLLVEQKRELKRVPKIVAATLRVVGTSRHAARP